MSRDGEGLCGCVSCGRVDDFKLTIGSFPLKRWKEGGGVMNGLMVLSVVLALGEMALLMADHMPPLPRELIVMLD